MQSEEFKKDLDKLLVGDVQIFAPDFYTTGVVR